MPATPPNRSAPPLWQRLRASRSLAFGDAVLRGSGQVVFMDSPLTGLLFFAAMLRGAWAGGTTLAVALGSVLGCVVATATAHLLRAEGAGLRAGLYGFNGMLVGAGLPTFLVASPPMWLMLVCAAACSTGVTLALAALLRGRGIPGLTFPFVLVTWLALLAAYRLPLPGLAGLPPAAPTAAPVMAVLGAGLEAHAALAVLGQAALTNVSQVFFVDDALAGALFVLGLALHSRACAALAVLGGLVASACALLAGADAHAVAHGLWGYSAALTAPAVGCVFLRPGARTWLLAAAASVLTALAQGATAAAAATLGLPALTFPFVLCTWLVLLAQQALAGRQR